VPTTDLYPHLKNIKTNYGYKIAQNALEMKMWSPDQNEKNKTLVKAASLTAGSLSNTSCESELSNLKDARICPHP
jgi:hypothetical protein